MRAAEIILDRAWGRPRHIVAKDSEEVLGYWAVMTELLRVLADIIPAGDTEPAKLGEHLFSAGSLPGDTGRNIYLRAGSYGDVKNSLNSKREVAQRLRVCPATVYKLCAASELVHVRISNAIRVAPTDLAEFIARRRSR